MFRFMALACQFLMSFLQPMLNNPKYSNIYTYSMLQIHYQNLSFSVFQRKSKKQALFHCVIVRNRNLSDLGLFFLFFLLPSSHFCFSNFLHSLLFIQGSHSKILPHCGTVGRKKCQGPVMVREQ